MIESCRMSMAARRMQQMVAPAASLSQALSVPSMTRREMQALAGRIGLCMPRRSPVASSAVGCPLSGGAPYRGGAMGGVEGPSFDLDDHPPRAPGSKSVTP